MRPAAATPPPAATTTAGKMTANKTHPWVRTVRHLVFASLFVAVLLAGVGSIIVWREVTTDLPPVERILNYHPPTATRIYADDGTPIKEFYVERRYLVPLQHIPPYVRAAFIAAEDSSFYYHHGVDFVSIARALWRNIQRRTVVQGGSTITQQVVKSLLLSPEKSYRRKLREIILALRIERQLSKDEILYLYLNQIYFGNGAYGVAAAARAYFGKDVDDLTLAEGALLAGLPRAPNRYSPIRHPTRAKARQRYVLARMEEEHYIVARQRRAALQEDIPLEGHKPEGSSIAPYYVEHVRRVLENRYGGAAPYQLGLEVHTALNLNMQAAAEDALRAGLEQLDRRQGYGAAIHHLEPGEIEPFLRRVAATRIVPGETYEAVVMATAGDRVTVSVGHETASVGPETPGWEERKGDEPLARGDVLRVIIRGRAGAGLILELDTRPPVEGALIALDTATGDVKAMVGGYDFRRSQFNRAIQSERQPGSAFKPLIYAAALERGYTPATLVYDGPIALANGNLPAWTPRNYNDRYVGWTTLRNALTHSLNTVTVRVVDSLGVPAVMESLKRFRVFRRMPVGIPSIALGSAEVTLLALTQAYAVFATLGERPEARFIVRIEDSEGRVLEAADPHLEPVLSPATAYLVTSMLQSVVEHGTGRRARALGRLCAGKTGTTNNFRDAWFVGFTPGLATGVWIGFDSERSLGKGVTGGRVAAPIWTKFMEKALEGRPIRDFRIPRDVTFVNVDEATGLRAVAGRPSVLEVFRRGTEPVRQPPPPEPPLLQPTDHSENGEDSRVESGDSIEFID